MMALGHSQRRHKYKKNFWPFLWCRSLVSVEECRWSAVEKNEYWPLFPLHDLSGMPRRQQIPLGHPTLLMSHSVTLCKPITLHTFWLMKYQQISSETLGEQSCSIIINSPSTNPFAITRRDTQAGLFICPKVSEMLIKMNNSSSQCCMKKSLLLGDCINILNTRTCM